ncbi:MAG TPA: VCBS repeat-containing protein, partial [Gemmataceae bacterium]|nr:VCBS repeat-containing protein [Gemmataceae bacterium]
MILRRVAIIAIILLVPALAAAFIPGTSFYLPDIFAARKHVVPGANTPIKPVPPAKEKGDPAFETLQLPSSETEYLWQVEHELNRLAKDGFSQLASALSKADGAALRQIMAEDFSGADMRDPKHVVAKTEYGDVERLEDSGSPPLALTRDEFVSRLIAVRKQFAVAPKVKFKPITFDPKQRDQFDGRWEGTALLRLNSEPGKGPPIEVIINLRYEILRPTQETLKKPGWLRAAGITQILTAKGQSYLFADVTEARGLKTSYLHDNWKTDKFVATTGGVYVCDFNRDGILDMLVTDVNGIALYQGRPDGTFEDVTTPMGLPRTPPRGFSAAAWIDIDGDGYDDLILGRSVFRNVEGKRFLDYTSVCNLPLPPDISNLQVADFDRDGKLDIYATRNAPPGNHSWLQGTGNRGGGNFLYRNMGNWQFEDVTASSGTGGGQRSTFSAAWLDANNDGWPDLMVVNEFGDGVLLINNGNGTFSEHALSDRPADFG